MRGRVWCENKLFLLHIFRRDRWRHQPQREKRALIIGSGPIRIGQGVEFDYSAVHGVLTLQELGFETIMINNNPETVSTDYEIADRLYFEPMTTEHIVNVAEQENIDFAIVQFGGQTAINAAEALEKPALLFLAHHFKRSTC